MAEIAREMWNLNRDIDDLNKRLKVAENKIGKAKTKDEVNVLSIDTKALRGAIEDLEKLKIFWREVNDKSSPESGK